MEEKLKHLSNCVTALWIFCLILLVPFLISLSIGAYFMIPYCVLCGLFCVAFAVILSSFIRDLRATIDDMERKLTDISNKLYLIQHTLEKK